MPNYSTIKCCAFFTLQPWHEENNVISRPSIRISNFEAKSSRAEKASFSINISCTSKYFVFINKKRIFFSCNKNLHHGKFNRFLKETKRAIRKSDKKKKRINNKWCYPTKCLISFRCWQSRLHFPWGESAANTTQNVPTTSSKLFHHYWSFRDACCSKWVFFFLCSSHRYKIGDTRIYKSGFTFPRESRYQNILHTTVLSACNKSMSKRWEGWV